MGDLNLNQALSLAVKYHQEGNLDKAEIIYREILDGDQNNAEALHLLGLIAHQKGKHEKAIIFINKAIEINPNSALFYSNLGMIYDVLGKEEESAVNFQKALEINPKHNKAFLAHYNLGVFYSDKGRINQALEHYNKALELNGNFAEAHWNKGLVLLLLGRFKEGWKEYEYRFKKEKPSDSRVFDKPKWDGSSLKGKRILVLSEQGFGDNINFIRYISLVKERGGHVIFECKKGLKKLFECFFGIDEIVEKDNEVIPNIEFDFYIHLMSLPGIFNTSLGSIPNMVPYLRVPLAAKKFKTEFNNNDFNIGIVWAGNPNQMNDKNRSTRFDKFKILKKIPGIKLFSLQKGEGAKQFNDSEIINT